GRTPANTLSNPFPNGLIAPTGSSLGALTGVGTNLTGALYDIHRGYSQQWNFTIQHQPWQNWLFEAAYVGNHGVHLFMYNRNLNLAAGSDVQFVGNVSRPVSGQSVFRRDQKRTARRRPGSTRPTAAALPAVHGALGRVSGWCRDSVLVPGWFDLSCRHAESGEALFAGVVAAAGLFEIETDRCRR